MSLRFLLARLHMDSLVTKGTRKAVREALKTLPKELESTYQEAMQRIQSQNDDDKQLAERVLYWISFAFRPLALNELQHALAVEFGESELDEENIPDEELLTSLCAGLVIVDKQSNVIRLVHYTTQEYFERIRMVQFPNAQAEIAKTCLTYLSFEVFADGYCSGDKEMEIRLQRNPLLQYAARNWGNHGRMSPERVVIDQILEFLSQDSKISCFAQAMEISEYRWKGYSQGTSKNFPRLCAAACFGLIETVKLLLEKGADIEAKTSNGRTTLYVAASNGHEAVVRLLLEKGANTEAVNKNKWTALHAAASNGHEAVVRLLLEKGANTEAEHENGWTALHVAASNGHEAVVRLLLEKGANTEAKHEYGRTALQVAAQDGHEAVVRLLLEKGADIEAVDQDGWTALQVAAWDGHEAVVRLLLEKGADTEAEDKYGWTALYTAASSGYEAVVKLLEASK
jgi:ankyrin repeat protein